MYPEEKRIVTRPKGFRLTCAYGPIWAKHGSISISWRTLCILGLVNDFQKVKSVNDYDS